MTPSDANFWNHPTSYWYEKLNSSANGLSQAVAHKLYLQTSGVTRVRSRFVQDSKTLR